jgi:hypothetical protein
MLERYCEALGVAVFDTTTYGPDAVLIESAVRMAADGTVMSLREVQAWLQIVPGAADLLPG